MILTGHMCLYSKEFPEGKVFQPGDEWPDGFVDTPTKLGIKKKEPVPELSKQQQLENEIVLNELKIEYFELFNKKPHHKSTIKSLTKLIDDKKAE